MKIKVTNYIASRIVRTKEDFKIEYSRASGCGGQHRNSTDSKCKITDLKTGLSAECQDERVQRQNKNRAFETLARRLVAHYAAEEQEIKENNKEKLNEIRVYNFNRQEMKDHRSNNKYNLKRTLEGNLDSVIKDVIESEARYTPQRPISLL